VRRLPSRAPAICRASGRPPGAGFGVDPALVVQPGQQPHGVVLLQQVQGQRDGLVEGEPGAAGEDRGAARGARQQRAGLRLAGGVVEHHQHAPAGQLRPVAGGGDLQVGREVLVGDAEGAQEVVEHAGGGGGLGGPGAEVGVQHAVGEVRGEPVGGVDRQRGLADAGVAVDGDDRGRRRGGAVGAQLRVDGGELLAAVGEAGDVGGQQVGARGAVDRLGRRPVQLGRAAQDGGLELLQGGRVVAAGQQPGDAAAAGLGRLVHAVAAVQGQREQAAEALVVGLLGAEQLQLGEQLGVAADLQVGLDAGLPGGQVQALQPGDLVLDGGGGGDRLGDRAAPQPQGPVEAFGGGGRVAGLQRLAALLDQPLEADDVKPFRLDPQQVAGLGGDQPRRGLAGGPGALQDPAEVVDVAADGGPGRGPAGGAEHGPDLGRRHGAVGAQQQQGEHGAELGAELHGRAVDLHQQRPEDPEVHGASGGCRGDQRLDGISTRFPRSADSLYPLRSLTNRAGVRAAGGRCRAAGGAPPGPAASLVR
jgi:hypothetical protein